MFTARVKTWEAMKIGQEKYTFGSFIDLYPGCDKEHDCKFGQVITLDELHIDSETGIKVWLEPNGTYYYGEWMLEPVKEDGFTELYLKLKSS